MKTQMKLAHSFFSILCIASLFVACSKGGEDGQDGNIGPQGEQGIAGPKGDQGEPGQDGAAAAQGEQGPAGEDGEPGTANVIYSEWLPSPFANHDPDETLSIDAPVNAPGLTHDIANNGAVLVYGRVSNSTIFAHALPVALFRRNQNYRYFTQVSMNSSVIRIIVESIDGGVIGHELHFEEFRYVLIPGGIPESGKSASEEYSKMSYEEIAERFSIPD